MVWIEHDQFDHSTYRYLTTVLGHSACSSPMPLMSRAIVSNFCILYPFRGPSNVPASLHREAMNRLQELYVNIFDDFQHNLELAPRSSRYYPTEKLHQGKICTGI